MTIVNPFYTEEKVQMLKNATGDCYGCPMPIGDESLYGNIYLQGINQLAFKWPLLAETFAPLFNAHSEELGHPIISIIGAHEHFIRAVKREEAERATKPKRVGRPAADPVVKAAREKLKADNSQEYKNQLSRCQYRKNTIEIMKRELSMARIQKANAISDCTKQWNDYLLQLQNNLNQAIQTKPENWVLPNNLQNSNG